ncbi:GNAT family N-acetyltransferase [Bacillus sp. FJAT-49711]|uniref:GNAT family N-acetyltransferase n=1 Tax=Bacillus sp. FJAT-49711 TaxID=2833585 RepID=UPI001BCA3C5A|nr:GNAT family N-acetyltransferase [Bacillus sp. FJAT-49711]MBS4220172.1 GNAT family N-acetyltransferase [Bacillus sp. FJAT-49711]
MEAIIHKHIDTLEEILPQWTELKEDFLEITVFQDISWLKSWWDYKQEEWKITPYIVEVKKENKTIGIIPLYLSDNEFCGFNFRVLRPIGIDQSDYLVPILSKRYSSTDIVKKAMEKIYADKDNWDYFEWRDIPEGSTFDLALKNELQERSNLMERKKDNICPHLVLNKNTEMVVEKFNGSFLKGLLRYDRKLKREGELKFHKVYKETEIEPVMSSFFELHCKRWKDTSTPSKFEDKKEREFAMQAAKGLFKSNLLYLVYLTHNDNILVVFFGMKDGTNIYYYIHAMDPDYKKYKVGHLIMYYLILDSIEKKYNIVDFLRGDEPYKYNWGTTNKFNIKYLFFSYSVRSVFFRLIYSIYNTYYSKRFSKKPLAIQLLMKSIIRSGIFALGLKRKLRQKLG